DAAEQIDVIRAVIAPATAALHRLDLGKPGFPEPQHMLRDVEFLGDLANGSERIRRLVQNHVPFRSQLRLSQSALLSAAPASPLPLPLIRCFKIAEGLNTIT